MKKSYLVISSNLDGGGIYAIFKIQAESKLDILQQICEHSHVGFTFINKEMNQEELEEYNNELNYFLEELYPNKWGYTYVGENSDRGKYVEVIEESLILTKEEYYKQK